MKWETVPFGDLFAEKTRNGVYKPADFHGSGVKIVNMGELFAAGKIGSQRMERVELSESERHVSLLRENDLLFARRSLVESGAGKVSIVHGLTEETTFESSIIRVRLNTELCNPLFYYYWLSSFPGRAVILPLITGLNVKGIRGSELTGIKVSYPPLNIQNRISDILSAYDSLIENNQKQITLLEEAAQRLYKEWFIDLRFPGHESTPIHDGIPAGWEKDRADSFFEITIGKTPPRAEKQWFVSGKCGIPWGSISDMGNAGAFVFDTAEALTDDAVDKHNVKVIPAGTVLLSFKLTVGRVSIATTNMCTNEAIAHFRVDDTLRSYTYFYLKSFEYDKLGNTSAISQAVNSKIIKAMPFIMPDKETLLLFSKVASPFLNEIYQKQAQNRFLVEARDRLLPKLMSGEIEV